MNGFLTIFCSIVAVVLLLFVFFILPAWFRKEPRTTPELEQLMKEMGHKPYTKKELQAMEAEERRTHNANARSGAFWAGSDTYIDYDGHTRNV